jgi:signal transduction histidine kinase
MTDLLPDVRTPEETRAASRFDERVAALEAGLADAAHDVRSPLQAVIGNAELQARDPSMT